MTMLSRVADRLYWMARYLERTEDTARLTQSYTHLVMDIPAGTELGWEVLISILDAGPLFEQRFRAYNEQNVLNFLLADKDNGCSVAYSIAAARENVRTTRDVLPEEVWEHINGLYLYCQEHAESSIGRRNRHRFLDQVIARCQMINGLLLTTLCRDHAYRFIKLGALLERADMTTRIIDVGAAALLADQRHQSSVDPLLWASMLQSLSARGTYDRHMGPIVEANSVVDFVFREASLPRSVRFCLNGIRRELQPLKNNTEALKLVERYRRSLSRFNVEDASKEQLHEFIDRFQSGLNELSDTIVNTWFLPDGR
ncbi:MAG: alpha-E domain-containing protein [Halioglobus sp.]